MTLTYPSAEVVSNTYDNAGWLNQVNTSQGNTLLLSNATYSSSDYGGAAGLMTNANLSNRNFPVSWSMTRCCAQ